MIPPTAATLRPRDPATPEDPAATVEQITARIYATFSAIEANLEHLARDIGELRRIASRHAPPPPGASKGAPL